ncbi:HAD family hydrolase [Alphaproteobacteria bacterium]|nr:HAD family hydrolase [Alphaproteobacteria bacterium]
MRNRPAVFFDRDGVLNHDLGYVCTSDRFKWIDGAVEAIKYLNSLDYYTFVVSNQSGVARGFYKEKDVLDFHKWMNNELFIKQAYIDEFYFCPHYKHGKVKEYSKFCDNRKPEPGMLLRAFNQWDIDKENSFLIGDSETDLIAARKAGIKGYLFEKGNLHNFLIKILELK